MLTDCQLLLCFQHFLKCYSFWCYVILKLHFMWALHINLVVMKVTDCFAIQCFGVRWVFMLPISGYHGDCHMLDHGPGMTFLIFLYFLTLRLSLVKLWDFYSLIKLILESSKNSASQAQLLASLCKWVWNSSMVRMSFKWSIFFL